MKTKPEGSFSEKVFAHNFAKPKSQLSRVSFSEVVKLGKESADSRITKEKTDDEGQIKKISEQLPPRKWRAAKTPRIENCGCGREVTRCGFWNEINYKSTNATEFRYRLHTDYGCVGEIREQIIKRKRHFNRGIARE